MEAFQHDPRRDDRRKTLGHVAAIVAAMLSSLLACGCTADELWGDPDEDDDSGIIVIPPSDDDVVDETVLYGVNDMSDNLFEVDPASGAITFIGALNPDTRIFTTPSAVAVRESDGAVFVWNNADPLDPPGESGTLLSVDVCSGFAVPVDPSAPGQGEIRGLAFPAVEDGSVYGVGPSGEDEETHALWRISVETGLAQRVNPDATFPPMGGLDMNLSTSFFVAIELGGEPGRMTPLRIFTIDRETGVADVDATIDASIVRGDSIVDDLDEYLAGGLSRDQEPVFFSLNPDTGQIIDLFPTTVPIQGMAFGPACTE